MITTKRFKDKTHGIVTVIEHEHGLIMHNIKPNPHGRWVCKNNTYQWKPYKTKPKKR